MAATIVRHSGFECAIPRSQSVFIDFRARWKSPPLEMTSIESVQRKGSFDYIIIGEFLCTRAAVVRC